MYIPLLLSVLLLASAKGFQYSLVEDFSESRFSFSERYMFASNEGPSLDRGGESYIHIDLDVSVMTHVSSDAYNMTVLCYRTGAIEFEQPPVDLCRSTVSTLPAHFEWPQIHSFALGDASRTIGGAGTFRGKVLDHYEVKEAGLQYAMFQLCPAPQEPDVKVSGELTFKNPYGYLPGMYYGYLPFQAARTAAFVVVVFLFVAACTLHRQHLLRLHWAMLGVLVLAAFESLSWLIAYRAMNDSGHPYCCPFPQEVVVATTMEVLRKTSSRLLLLLVCLGYGITRVELDKVEKAAVVALTVAYLASTIMDNVSFVLSATHVTAGTTGLERSAAFAVPAMLCDMMYLFWIYVALMNMLQALQDANETYKLDMYTKLSWTISCSVLLFMLLAVALTAGQAGSNTWEWQWMWVQAVSWQILNFGVLIAVCWLWRPSDRSAQLAYSKQVPTGEEDADAADAGIGGLEMAGVGGRNFTIGTNDDDDDDDDEGGRHGGDGAGSNGDFVGGGGGSKGKAEVGAAKGSGDDGGGGGDESALAGAEEARGSASGRAALATRSQQAAIHEMKVRPGSALL